MFKYLVMSDIHLGHRTNKTVDIITNLQKFFIDYRRELKDLDMLILAGDVYDRLLSTHSLDYIAINVWIVKLVKMCKQNDISLRVLEGTPSHDWKQCKLISRVIEELELDIDYRYVDTVEIERNKRYGIDILYIPDEYSPDSRVTYRDVLEELKKNKLDKVDIAIMHGCFRYQLPIELESMHVEEDYLRIVRNYISIGHIHTMSIYDRILANGSFDRLAHGEEEDKGAMLIVLDKLRGNRYKFLVNRNSKIYKTIEIEDIDTSSFIKKLDKELKKIKDNSYVRVISNIEHSNGLLRDISNRYPSLNIKLKKKKDKEEKIVNLLPDRVIVDGINITKDNIINLLEDSIAKYNYTGKYREIFIEELNNVI